MLVGPCVYLTVPLSAFSKPLLLLLLAPLLLLLIEPLLVEQAAPTGRES